MVENVNKKTLKSTFNNVNYIHFEYFKSTENHAHMLYITDCI
jgi:hypothetical protein